MDQSMQDIVVQAPEPGSDFAQMSRRCADFLERTVGCSGVNVR